MSKSAVIARRSALNQLVIACRNEISVLEAILPRFSNMERRKQLMQQTRHRQIFRKTLSAQLRALGGVPARRASYPAQMSGAFSRVWGLLAGAHQGDAYALCSRSTERTALAYVRALKSSLPIRVRPSVVLQYEEIEADLKELRRLRWGASPSPNRAPEAEKASVLRQRRQRSRDALALGVWNDDGGAA